MLTRMCFFPWFYRLIHAGGMICPCCAKGDTDYGDWILDEIEAGKRGKVKGDVLNNEAIVSLKRGLLTGELHPMCQKCAFASQQMIDTDDFKAMLEKQFDTWGVSFGEEMDYAKIDAVRQVGIGITNRCNLRCIYCNQSVLAEVNPYFKLDFPEEEILNTLEMFVERGVTCLETGAFGEATIHPKWGELFWDFHRRHPEVSLALTTNLCREYSQEEIELLAEHSTLRVSMDTLNPELFAKIRVNGKLDLLLRNLDRIEQVIIQKGYDPSRIKIDSVICNLTWREIPEVSRFVFKHGYAYHITNYEKRENSVAIRDGILKQVSELSEEERMEARSIILDVKKQAQEKGLEVKIQEGLLGDEDTACDYNCFKLYDDNPIYKAFYEKYPHGAKDIHFDVEFDHLGRQHAGIKIKKGQTLQLNWDSPYNTFIIREVHIYKDGTSSPKYEQKVFLDYRKKVNWNNMLEYCPQNKDENIEYILLQVLDWWKEKE